MLNRLWEEDGISQVELAERTVKDKPNITRMLDVLERRDLISRELDDYDRRASKIYLTKAGKALEEALVPIATASLAKATQGLSDTEIEQMKKTLNRIYDNLA